MSDNQNNPFSGILSSQIPVNGQVDLTIHENDVHTTLLLVQVLLLALIVLCLVVTGKQVKSLLTRNN